MDAPKDLTGESRTADTGSPELQAKQLQLHWLLQVTKAINYNFSNKQLLDVYEHALQSQLRVDQLVLLVHDNGWKCALQTGSNLALQGPALEQVIRELDHNPKAGLEQSEWIRHFDSVVPVFHKEQILAYALLGGFGNSVIQKKNELVSYIQTLTNLIVVAMENNRLAQEKIRQAALKKEMELAAQMQNMLFPSELPSNEDYEVHATYLPHTEVGGDYYDFIPLSENEFVFCMADVSGKGIPAALLMSNFQANLHAYLRHKSSLTELIHELNSKVFRSAKGEKFITFFIGRYNRQTRELHYINAGHNPPFLIHDKVVFMLTEGSTGLGMFEEIPFVNSGKTFIPHDASLTCYTDGVTDVVNDTDEDFGVERLRYFLLENLSAGPAGHLHRRLIDTLHLHKQTRPYTDDITLMTIYFK
jgi:sigma-B regulation protein RsbU (phosphoserine phosphatase)